MARIVVTEFVTLDGVFEDPGGSEGVDRGGWAFQFERGEEGDKFKLDETMGSEAMLLGRRVTSCPVTASHNLIVRSALAVARSFPSGENASDRTSSR